MATDFERLKERTTIEFPHFLSMGELRQLFREVGEKTSCRFTYTT